MSNDKLTCTVPADELLLLRSLADRAFLLEASISVMAEQVHAAYHEDSSHWTECKRAFCADARRLVRSK